MGASGYFIVMGGTRNETYQVGLELEKLARTAAPQAKCVILINKSDLISDWEITPGQIARLMNDGFKVIQTSAKDNLAVETAFTELTRMMIK